MPTKKKTKKREKKDSTSKVIRHKTSAKRDVKRKLRRVITPEKAKKVKPAWTKYKKEAVEKLIVELAEKGYNQARIGSILRDQYGIPKVKLITKTSLSQILKEKGLSKELPEDLYNLIKKAVVIQEHLTKNKRDGISKRGLELVEARIRRLSRYYRRKGQLPPNWKYIPERAKLLVK